MEQDLKAARKLQRILIPREAPDLRGLSIGIRARPAREISGDVHDFFEQGESDAVITFGDVSGKGAAAALYGALVGGLLRTLAPRRYRPAQLLKALNEALLERRVDAQYATLLVALWEPQRKQFVFANAGAEPPLIYRNGEVIRPKIEGVPIGLLEDREYDVLTFPAQPGDIFLFFSDGVEDQLNEKEDHYSRTRVTKLLRKHAAEPAQAIADAFITALDQYRGSMPITDDQSIVAVRVLG